MLRWLLPAGVVALFAAQLISRPAEPMYKGQSLTYWLETYDRFAEDHQRAREAADGVRHIGTNAIPRLLAWIHYEHPEWRQKVAGAGQFLPVRLGALWESLAKGRENQSRLAEIGFDILGPEAATAVPELISLMDIRNTADPAVMALGSIGKPALPLLVQALTNRANPVYQRGAAVWAMEIMGTDASDAVPVLIECVKIDPKVRHLAAGALGTVTIEPSLVFPVLTNAMHDPSPEVRWCAIDSLGKLRAAARSAIPALVESLNDADETVQLYAGDALHLIDPEKFDRDGKVRLEVGRATD